MRGGIGWIAALLGCGPTLRVPEASTDGGSGSDATGATSRSTTIGDSQSGATTGVLSDGSSSSTGLPDDLPDCSAPDRGFELLACDVLQYSTFVVDAQWVYFASTLGVYRVPVEGGISEAVAAATGASHLRLEADHVYWGEFETGVVARAPRDGGARQVLLDGLTKPSSIVVADGAVFVTQYGEQHDLLRTPAAAGDAVALYGGLDHAGVLAHDAGNLYWATSTNNGNVPGPLAAGTVDGGAANTLSSDVGGVEDVIPSPPWIYFLRYAVEGSSLRRTSIDGAVHEEIIAEIPDHPWELSIDDTHAYWTWTDGGPGPGAGGLQRVALGGGAIEDVLPGLALAHAIELAGEYAYFVDDDTLGRVQKP